MHCCLWFRSIFQVRALRLPFEYYILELLSAFLHLILQFAVSSSYVEGGSAICGFNSLCFNLSSTGMSKCTFDIQDFSEVHFPSPAAVRESYMYCLPHPLQLLTS